MNRLFSKKALARLKAFNGFGVVLEATPEIELLWFQAYSSECARKLKPNLNMHRHTFYEIHFVLEGEISYKTDSGQVFRADSGGYIIIPPDTEHQIESESVILKKSVLAFSLLDPASEKYRFPSEMCSVNKTEWVKALFTVLALALEADNGTAHGILKNAISTMIFLISESVTEPDSATVLTKKDDRIVKAKMFIADNAARNISVQEVASFVYLSVKQLERLFVEYEQIKISDYIAKARCETAKKLLECEALSIEQVAKQLCFSNIYNFSRFFKRVEGVTPGVYKKIKTNKGD